MILYVNGDSHTAAAEATNPHGFASDDSRYFYMGEAPHPDNLAVSWGRVLSDNLKTTFHCHAQAGASNDRIIRTSQEFLTKCNNEKSNCLMVIQWSTWERQEWQINGKYYQVGASGTDSVPEHYQTQYKEFIAGIDWHTATQHEHDKIWAFHKELDRHSIPHIFFNGNNHFDRIKNKKDWGNSYIGPYEADKTYDSILKSAGYQTVAPGNWHYGPGAHRHWAKFMLQYIIANQFI